MKYEMESKQLPPVDFFCPTIEFNLPLHSIQKTGSHAAARPASVPYALQLRLLTVIQQLLVCQCFFCFSFAVLGALVAAMHTMAAASSPTIATYGMSVAGAKFKN